MLISVAVPNKLKEYTREHVGPTKASEILLEHIICRPAYVQRSACVLAETFVHFVRCGKPQIWVSQRRATTDSAIKNDAVFSSTCSSTPLADTECAPNMYL